MDKHNFTFIDLFAGIGGTRLGFEAVGGKCVWSCEWDKHAQATYETNFGEVPAGDITEVPAEEIPSHDILVAGFPCQAFSIMGDMLGFADTRGTLFFEIERILRNKRPPAFFLENVRQLVTHDKRRTLAIILNSLASLGYCARWQVLNTLDFGLPQKRERVYIVGFSEDYPFQFPVRALRAESVVLADILDPDDQVDPKYFASDYIRRKRRASVDGKEIPFPSIWHENKSGNVSPLPYSCALRAGASLSYLLVNGIRRLTPREQLRLQGFPEAFEILGPEGQIRKQTGNSVSVPVIEAIAARMLEAIRAGAISEETRSCDSPQPR